MTPNVHRYPNVQKLSTAAATLVCQVAEQCVQDRGDFTMALSGGSTPKMLYEYLAQEPYVRRMPWTDTHLFWGDERYVPSDHADSNFAMAAETLIEHVPIPSHNIYRIPTEMPSPEETAAQYETILREAFLVFDPVSNHKKLPVFDVILLGMGKDGHTASLFPESPVLNEQERWVAATPIPKLNPPVRRITLTFPIINAAKTVLFLLTGVEKQPVIQTILEDPEKAYKMYPAARVHPEGELLWFLA